MAEEYSVKTYEEADLALREIMQEIALAGLQRGFAALHPNIIIHPFLIIRCTIAGSFNSRSISACTMSWTSCLTWL